MERITFAPVVYSQYKRKDGNYTIKMRITFKKKVRYITTSEIATPEQLTKKTLSIKDDELKNRLHKLEGRMRDAVSDLDMYSLENKEIDDIISHMKRRLSGEFRLEFFSFWEEAVAKKPEGSRDNYMVALRNFKRFVSAETMDISKVTAKLMREYQSWLEEKHGKGARAVTMYTASVKHVHGLARFRYNDEENGEHVINNPFDFYKPPKQRASAHRNVPAYVIQTMIGMRSKLEGREKRAVEAYLLSFALMGMNAPDLLSCKPPKDGILIYNRQKTRDRRADKAEMRVRIEQCVMNIYKEWEENNGVHAFTFHRLHENHRQFTFALAKG
ncbi:MAG: phage integrase SAM-like domain-containing protein, partial [Bacteroidales bacterium]|nr:phage integrase SAM-like domain-containing protein [Bacteroidales bacterium]